jgi:hypothetical protein
MNLEKFLDTYKDRYILAKDLGCKLNPKTLDAEIKKIIDTAGCLDVPFMKKLGNTFHDNEMQSLRIWQKKAVTFLVATKFDFEQALKKLKDAVVQQQRENFCAQYSYSYRATIEALWQTWQEIYIFAGIKKTSLEVLAASVIGWFITDHTNPDALVYGKRTFDFDAPFCRIGAAVELILQKQFHQPVTIDKIMLLTDEATCKEQLVLLAIANYFNQQTNSFFNKNIIIPAQKHKFVWTCVFYIVGCIDSTMEQTVYPFQLGQEMEMLLLKNFIYD